MDAGNFILQKHGLWYVIAGLNSDIDEDMSWAFDRQGWASAIDSQAQNLGLLTSALKKVFAQVPSVCRICLDTIHLPSIILAVELVNLVGSFSNQATIACILRSALPADITITGFISDPYDCGESY